MRSLLADRFQTDLAASSLWKDFVTEPTKSSAELLGTLEAFVEGDPSLAQELEELARQYRMPADSTKAMGESPAERLGGASAPVLDAETNSASEEGKGAYLYGNLKPGAVTLESRTGFSEQEICCEKEELD
jgi:hypothetical protein